MENREESTGNDMLDEQRGNEVLYDQGGNDDLYDQKGNEQAYAHKGKEIEELEEIIQTVPYSLPVALIKICQINKYTPLSVEKYYEYILPTFHLLRRTDGTKYTSTSINAVRSAMLANKLFYRNDKGLYELNIPNAVDHVKQLKKKAASEHENGGRKKDKDYNFGSTEFDFGGNSKMLGKKRKLKAIVKSNEYKNVMKKYEKGFNLFDNLLKVSFNDKNITSKLNFDMQYLTDMDLNDDENPNTHKIIGMLTVFKFFKPFIERSFNSYRIQENIIQKLTELNNEVNSLNIMEE